MPSDLTVETERKWLDLSLAQQAVWLDAKLSGSAAYQLGGWARIAGSPDEAALRQAISLIMARHDGLRLRVDDELPRQWLDESVEPPLAVVDLPANSPDPDAAFQRLIEERFASAMPLGDHPLFSVELIRAGANLNYMLWRFHHLLADVASVAVTISHWLNAYEALTSGTPQELTPGSSYLKTISSDAAYLESAGYHKDLAYWTSRFDPLPPPLIPDLEFRASSEEKVPTVEWTLAGREFAAFQDAAKAAGASIQRALFALFAITLGRRYGQNDIVSGIALHRRDLANRHTIGMMAGVIPVRCQFDPFWTLEECIQAYSEQMDRDLRHQKLPVDVLSRALGMAGTGRARLFEAGMSYMPSNRGWNDSAVEGLPVITGQVNSKEASPISLRITELESGDALAIALAVNLDYLNAEEASSLANLLQTACRIFVHEPDKRFEDFPTLTSPEHSLAVIEWNKTDATFETGTLDSLFTAQARRTPHAIAVIGRDGKPLTYAEVDEKSTRLARTLAAHGVKPERVVGVQMERSSETIIAFLAILKAGGVYLPLDPAYPKDRLEYLRYDAGAMLVLESLDSLTGDADLPADLADPRRLAYIIYTSGTTGRPKGVAVPHSAAVNLVFARNICYGQLGPGDRVLAVTSVSFDVSVSQLLLPLLMGATVVIAGDIKTMGGAGFWSLVTEHQITHVNFVPSFVELVLDAAPQPVPQHMKLLMLGGEALSGHVVARVNRALPGLKILNIYGPTETCIDATYLIATPEDAKLAILPIGRPLSNYHAYILNDFLEPVGIGITGELYLGGAGLARGYVNVSDLTSERFIANPFSATPGDRLYRTGDRTRWRADGTIEYLGRVDRQIKIRGFRVEPGEIASVLLEHPAVAQAVVIARGQESSSSMRLIAYVVPREEDGLPETSNLRGFLAGRLPDYMVPAAIVFIGAIPLNRNGKLDEKALPSPDMREGEFVAPRSATEQTVAKLFAEVLGLESCGATDHFFELGGHSLLATSLVSKFRTAGIKVPLRTIFEAPTVELLARRIDASLPASTTGEAITPQVRPADIPLSFPQERIWFVDRLQQDSSYNIPIAFELRGHLDIAAAEKALERIVARHEALRTRIILRDEHPVQQILEPAPAQFDRTDLSSLPYTERQAALKESLVRFAKHRFDLANDAPFLARLFILEPNCYVLSIVIHHVAFDGWSAGIFLAEFTALYSAFVHARPAPLPAPVIQYADFALWQRQQNWDADLAYWLEELEGAPAYLELPSREVADAETVRLASVMPISLDEHLHAELLKLAHENGASLFMVLHAAFAFLLSRWSGQDDVVIGTVTANRNRTELESIIGCFVNTLALRTKIEPGESFASLLGRVKHADLAAYAHQDLPFENLVQALHPERSLNQTPIFQVMLVLQNAPLPPASLPELTLEPVLVDAEIAKFDLTLTLAEENGALAGAIEYASNRFEPETIAKFARQFHHFLAAVAAQSDIDPAKVDLVDLTGPASVLGRVDEQIKIRGFRVEPGEVEAQLRRQPGIQEAAVIVQSARSGNRLIAYFTGDGTVEIETLRAAMAAALPDHLVPSAFIKLDKLPLTSTGKLDRKALPSPHQSSFVKRTFEAPVGEAEEKMAAIWAEMLKLERVGRHDNFFELGGHSLMAISLIERMKRQGVPVDVRDLFLTPTIAGLAAAVSSNLALAAVPANLIRTDSAGITPDMLPLVNLTQPQIDRIVASMPGGTANIQDIYPLAPLQEGILFQHRITPKGDPYLTPFLLSFDSRPRLDGFLSALNQVIARHDALRTAMQWKELDQPVQVVLRSATLPIEEVELDASSLAPDAAHQLAERFNQNTYRLDLTQAPLLKAVVAHDTTRQRWLLLLLTHHLILDQASMEIMLHELRALMADPHNALPPSLPYRNFIAHATAVTTEEDQKAFFTRMLAGVDEPTAPFGLADVHANTAEAVEGRLELDASLGRRIRERARALGVTPASLFHTAWATVLRQVSGKSSVVFGTVLFGRMRSGAGAGHAVGMLINTLPIRLDVDNTGAAASVLRTHRLLAELMAHENASLALAQRCSAVPPPAPLFSSLFNYRYNPGDHTEIEWPGVEIVDASGSTKLTNYPLAMAVDDFGARFLLTALAHPRVDRDRVCRYLQQAMTSLLDLLEREPDTALEALQVVPRTERHMLLEEWNRTDAKFEQGTLDGLFAAQARRTPNALAVVGRDGKEWTYAELDAQATRLARQLAAKGVQPEHVVGVRMQRSAETIIALLAILKTGGVYLPLDPAYPQDRLDYISQDAGAILVLDSINGLEGEADLPQLTDPNRLAYIIYTSGTSGRPKGVAVPHTAPVNLAFARRACHDPIGPGDRVLAAISVGFDVSIGQLLLPLLSGAAVIIADDLKTMGASGFWSFLAQRGVTHINSVPSFFDSVLDAAPPASTLALKRLMLGGEALKGSLVARIQQTLPGVDVVNMYGPTEACIDATFHIATSEDLTAPVLPIGRPLKNYRAYVLDSRLEPVGIGMTGELYLGGAGLARGYINAPELTAERFVGDPFSPTPGAKLYRTGDLALWRADGVLEFMGRVDAQVKIRGFRVEPGEIESQLRKQPGIREACVVPYTTQGDTRLIAYYCVEDHNSVDIETLRKAMAAELPDYMVPSAFIKLDKLPLTANGKLDHKALPAPDQAAFAARAYEPPVGELEEKLAALWSELLKVEKVGRHDNFFELGGHSLSAMTLIERMQQQGLAVDVRALFGTPTVAGLAAASAATSLQIAAPENLIAPGASRITPDMLPLVSLSQAQIDNIVQNVPGGAANVQDIYPLSPLQQGILFQHLFSTKGDPYLAPFLIAFDQRERLNTFAAALEKIVARHDVLRSAMVSKDVEAPLQVVLRKVDISLEEISIDAAPGSADAATQLSKRFDPATFRLDLSHAPILRAFFAHDAARNRWLLLLLTHHLVLDLTSLSIMIAELRALTTNPNAELPAPVPYRNFIAQTIHGSTAEEHEAFFRRLVGDVEEPTAPFGLVDTQVNASEISEGTLHFDPELSQAIQGRSRVLGVTPASIFHVAWAAVLSFISGKPDVVFGTVLLGRMRSGAGADRAVGMFINTLPIRFAIGQTAVRQSILDAQKLLGELMVHEHAPLASAQRASAVPAPAPLFSSLLNYRYSPEDNDATPWPGVEMIHTSVHTNYPVAMGVDDSGARFTLRCLAHPSAGADRINQYLLRAMEGLLDLLAHAPETPIQALRILPDNERQQVVDKWNRTAAKFEQGTLDALFMKQAQKTPTAVAIVAKDGSAITYADLDFQSTRLARQLVANGVKTESVVGVRMERSAETIIAFLAILKAGGVYLPLDPAYPPDRLDYMAKDAGAVLVLDSIHGLNGESDVPHLSDPNRLAYIIYTSGTTGKPKGVAVPHAAPVNLAFGRRACHDPLGVGDHVLAAISVGFDVSIGQLLLPLLSGATVVIAGDLKAMGPAEFWAFLAQRQVTHINSVPSFFDSILEAAPPAGTLALKRLMLGGEPLSGALVGRIQRALPNIQVVNMYGPTEACIDATYHIATQSDLSAAVLPIGRPLPNYRAYILDSHQQPAGIGIPGELYLGGESLARGYVNAPELTASRFLQDPFSPAEGARMYRTGDRAQWRADGEIEFLGRVDKQIKIRGHRIELGEIEAALLLHPAISRVAVIADNQQSGNTRLIAYIVLHPGSEEPEPQYLRDHLALHLPEYMIPSAFCTLPDLPLTANGKLDTKALPKVDAQRSDAVPFVAPSSATEIALQQIWQHILNVQPIGTHDNFFALGGHSLAAMRLINACNSHFKLNLQLRVLFDAPTIAQLATAIEHSTPGEELHPCLVRLQGNGTKPPLFCIHPAGGHVLGYSALANAISQDQPLYGIQARALLPGQPQGESIPAMAAEYIQAIKTVQPEGPYQFLGRSNGGLIAYEMAQQLHKAGEKVSLLCVLDTALPEKHTEEYTDEEFMRFFATNIGVDDLIAKNETAPNPAELLARAQNVGRLPGINTGQFERFHAVFRNSLRIERFYRLQPWSGPFVMFRALKRSGKPDDLPPDWSHLVSSPVHIDMDCTHDDFARERIAPALARELERLMADAAAQHQPVRQGHLIPLRSSGTKPKLFCIHPAGGNSLCYLPITRELGNDQPVFAIQASGLEPGEPLATSIEQMAADYLAAIRENQPAGPYQLLGMSTGGLIAFEIARQLKAQSQEVSFLGMIDTAIPHPSGADKLSGKSLLESVAAELGCSELMKQTPTPANLAELVESGIKADRLPSGYTLAQAERIAAVFLNTARLHLAYQPQSWQDSPVTLVRALRRTEAKDILPDWSPYVTHLENIDLDCGHYELVTPAQSTTVAALIARHLK